MTNLAHLLSTASASKFLSYHNVLSVFVPKLFHLYVVCCGKKGMLMNTALFVEPDTSLETW